MKTRFSISQALVLFCLAILSGLVSIAGEATNAPTVFNASIGGFFGTSYSVELTNNVLAYLANRNGKVIDSANFVPTAAKWMKFYNALDKLNVWQWHTNYVDYNVCDGTQWTFEIRNANHNLKILGSNCYPGVAGRPNWNSKKITAEFGKYLKAVGQLVGGKEFQ